jgi:alpha-tubulin suppressor-like RCC1 family protein
MSQPETMTVIPQATSQPARRRTLRGPSQRTMLMSAAVLAASLLVATAGLATQLTDRVGGTLYGWGSNSRGQLGDGTTTNRSTPHAVPGMDDVIHVAGSYNHSLAVTSQGTVWAWGKNNHGQLGNNTFSDSLVPVQVLALTGVVQVSASDNHSMALTADGQVWTWGRGSNDALGDGSTEDRSVPATVPGLDGVFAISAGGGADNCFAIRDDGTLWAWGSNDSGSLGIGQSGSQAEPVRVADLTDVVSVSSRWRHTIAITGDGSVWVWGTNTGGELGIPSDDLDLSREPIRVDGITGAVAAAAGNAHSVVVLADGRTLAWGVNGSLAMGIDDDIGSHPFPVPVAGLPPTGSVVAGIRHNLSLMPDGSVWSWGSNSYGELGHSSGDTETLPDEIATLTDVRLVAAGGFSSFAIVGGDQPPLARFGWSPTYPGVGASIQFTDASYGPPTSWSWSFGDGATSGAARPAHGYSTAGDYSVTLTVANALGSSTLTRTIAVGHGVGELVWAWGRNSFGQLGTGNELDRSEPTVAAGITDAIQLASGERHGLALSSDGTVWAWGSNANGRLGVADLDNSPFPVAVPGVSGAVAVAAGEDHSLALTSGGIVWAWGNNDYGQTGGRWDTPQPVPGLDGVSAITAGECFSVALRQDGTLWVWGDEPHRCNPGTNGPPAQVPDIGSVVAVAAGQNHVLALKADGTVWAWGSNSYSQLGTDAPVAELLPVQVPGITDVAHIAAGGRHSLAVDSAGTTWAWGDNEQGQLGIGSTSSPKQSPQQVTGLAGVVDLAGGEEHSLAVTADGSVWTWGSDEYGQLGNGGTSSSNRPSPTRVAGLDNVVSVAAYQSHSLALKSGAAGAGTAPTASFTWTPATPAVGGPVSFTDTSTGQPTSWSWDFGDGSSSSQQQPVHTFQSAGSFDVELTVSNQYGSDSVFRTVTVGAPSGSALWAWGNNQSGQLGTGSRNPLYIPDPVEVSSAGQVVSFCTGITASVIVKEDGTVWAWGANSLGQLGDGTFEDRLDPGVVPGLTGASRVTCGGGSVFAILDGGSLNSWGYNRYGQLGVGDFDDRNSPARVLAIPGVLQVSISEHHALALSADRTVWSWGANGRGQLGDGTTTDRSIPTQVSSLSNVIDVSAGAGHSLALKSDGTVWAWGRNDYGQLGDGTHTQRVTPTLVNGLSNVVDVEAGGVHSIALLSDGTAWAWGRNNTGQIGDGTDVDRLEPVRIAGLSNVAAVSAGRAFSLVILEDGTVWAWGYNFSGQLGDGTRTPRHTPVIIPGLVSASQVFAMAENSMAIAAAAAGASPSAGFTWSPATPVEGQPVHFTDQSTGSPTSWSWDFGDGSSSSQENPDHTFHSAGSFDVELTVSNQHGSDSIVKSVTVAESVPGTVTITEMDSARSPSELVVRPGDQAFLYYEVQESDGSPVSGGAIDYPPTFTGVTAGTGAWSWTVEQPGVLRLALEADQLEFSSSIGIMSFGTGSAIMEIDGTPVSVAAAPAPITLVRGGNLFADEWEVFAAGSAGATGTLGADAGAVSVGAAKLSVKGSGGMALTMTVEPDDFIALERRTELSVAATLKVPTLEADIGPGKFEAAGLSAGIERGFTYTQAFRYHGGDPDSEQARMMHAAFFLEAASIGNVAGGVYTGLLIKAIVATLNGLGGAGELLEQSLNEERSGTTLAGSVTTFSTGITTPTMGGLEIPLHYQGPSMGAAIASETATLYGAQGRTAPPVGHSGSATLAVTARTDVFNLNGIIPLTDYGIGRYTAALTETLTLDAPGRQPSEFELRLVSQADADIDLDGLRTSDFEGHNVGVLFGGNQLVSQLVVNDQTGIGGLTGEGNTPLIFGRQAFLDGMAEILDTATEWAGANRTAYQITAGAVSGKVFSIGGEIPITIVPPPTQVAFDIGIDFDYSQMRELQGATRVAVTGDGRRWLLQRNQADPDWRDSDLLLTVLAERVFTGLGPLARDAFLNLISFTWWPPFGDKTVIANGEIEVVVDDVVRGREAGAVTVDSRYSDHTGSLLSGDPSTLQQRVGGGKSAQLGWGLSTRRVIDPAEAGLGRADVGEKALDGSTVLTLIGQFIELELEDSGGAEVSSLSPEGTIRFNLYDDQVEDMGGELARLSEAQVFRYDNDLAAWQSVGGQVAADGSTLEAPMARTGAYAPGILTVIPPEDSDGDGILDGEEDLDGDGVVDAGETDPYSWDSDGDGVGDRAEIDNGSDPLDSSSTPNRAPILGYIGNRMVEPGEPLAIQIRALDPDGDAVEFFAQGLPSGASFDGDSGLLHWQDPVEGTWRLTVTVEDNPDSGPPLRDSETLLILVQVTTPTIADAGANLYLIPAAAHVAGAAGTSWMSDLAIHNLGDQVASVRLYLLPSGSGNASVRGRAMEVAAEASLALTDAVLGLFGESSASGSILVGADQDLVITSRTYNNAASGTFGQYVPGLAVGDALGVGDEARLIQLTRNNDFRTNIGFANAVNRETVVTVDLRRANGSQVAAKTFTVAPYGYLQKNDIFGVNVDDGYAIVRSDTQGATFFTYASVVDNQSGDPVLVLPAETVGTDGAWVAAAARVAGAGGTNWRTDLEVHNPGATQVQYTIEQLVRGQANPNPASRTYSLGPGRSMRYEDCLLSVFGVSSGAAALRVTPSAGSVMVASRTYNDAPGGTYGQFIPGVSEGASSIASGQEGRLIQLSRSSDSSRGFRTNLGFVNTTASQCEVDVTVYDSRGSRIGAKTYPLAAFEHDQANDVLNQVGAQNVDNAMAVVEPQTSGCRVIAFASVVDNRSGDPVYMAADVRGETSSPPAGQEITITLPGGVPMELVYIPAGTFMMGSPSDERGRDSDEDLHQVTLTRGYYLGKYEVTQRQWQAVMGGEPLPVRRLRSGLPGGNGLMEFGLWGNGG